MLVRRGADSDFVKVLDFGMARAGRDPDFVTRDGAVLGTARYIAPEGAQGGRVGPEGDVYAIATLLFQCIAGRTPFERSDAVYAEDVAIHIAAALDLEALERSSE